MHRCESEQFPKQQPKSTGGTSGFKESSREATATNSIRGIGLLMVCSRETCLSCLGEIYYRTLPTVRYVSIFDVLIQITGSRNFQPALKHSRRWSVCLREEAFLPVDILL